MHAQHSAALRPSLPVILGLVHDTTSSQSVACCRLAAKCVDEEEEVGKVERINNELVLRMHPTPMTLASFRTICIQYRGCKCYASKHVVCVLLIDGTLI